jgi:hypothetical protein
VLPVIKGFKVFWKVYRKGVFNPIDRVFYPAIMDAQDVHAMLEDDYDFPVTITLDECD